MTDPAPDTQTCLACGGAECRLPDPRGRLSGLHEDWQIDGQRLVRRFTFKSFARAAQMANLAAWLGERLGHHPDVAFGWGYCDIAFTSHEAGGLTDSDFAAARRLDRLVE